MLVYFCSRYTDSLRQLLISVGPRLGIARIDESEFFATLHSRLYFVNRHSRDFHRFHCLASTSNSDD
jgi:hypothetical protein